MPIDIKVADDEAAVVFCDNGDVRLVLPDGDDAALVPAFAQLAAIVAIKSGDPQWVQQMLLDLTTMADTLN